MIWLPVVVVLLIPTRRERETPIKLDVGEGNDGREAETLLFAKGRDDCEGNDICPEANGGKSAIRWERMSKAVDATCVDIVANHSRRSKE